MKNPRLSGIMALSGLSATAAFAAGPFSLSQDQSWGFFNTSSGIGALSSDVAPTQACWPYQLSPKTSGSYFLAGCFNTAEGFFALKQNTIGSQNTAVGAAALYSETDGINNTAVGALALFHDAGGRGNAAFGTGTLFGNTTGRHNTGLGAYALNANTAGNSNTAVGQTSMYRNTVGNGNTAVGTQSMYRATAGNFNTAVGVSSMYATTTASSNTAVGFLSLSLDSTGNENSAFGYGTLTQGTGTGNTAVGFNAGSALTSGSYNTYIGFGAVGISATDAFVTQIGAAVPQGVSANPTTYISGIYNNVLTSGLPVVVTANGQLGVQGVSSERSKKDIAPMPETGQRLAQLRPVTFRYQSDATGTIQYGLVAEEVAAVYPELVVHDGQGRVAGVRYDELAPMLLEEVQRERQVIAEQERRAASQEARIGELESALAEIRAAIANRAAGGKTPP